jgi:hypothetical protein
MQHRPLVVKGQWWNLTKLYKKKAPKEGREKEAKGQAPNYDKHENMYHILNIG